MSELVKKIEERLAIMLKVAFGTDENFAIKSVYGDCNKNLTVIFIVYGMPKDFIWHFNVGSLLDEDETDAREFA